MKMRIFTFLAASAMVAMSASAAVDVELSLVGGRSDISVVGYNDEGIFEYISSGDDTRSYDDAGNKLNDFGNTIFGLSKFELPSLGKYVLAFDYKIDKDIFNWVRARRTWDDGTSITVDRGFDKISIPFKASDDWTTYYIPLIDTNEWDWVSESWVDDTLIPYLIFDQDANDTMGPFTFQLKNCRVLSNDEAVAEITATPGDQTEGIYNFHGLLSEYDEFEGYNYYYIPQEGLQEGEQAIIGTENRLIPINPENKYFTFEYNSSDTFDMHVMCVMEEMEWYAKPVGDIHIEGRDDFGMDLDDASNWSTASIDLSDIINNDGFGKNFGSKHYLWIQCYEAPNFAMFYINNPRWSANPAPAGVETVGQEIVSGVPVYYNIQGQKVANPERGLYIKVENGKSSKVMIK